MCAVHRDGLQLCDTAGQNASATAVSKAWQDTAHCHLAASLAAAVPVPPMPATVPAVGANPPRHVLADLYLQTEHAAFDPDFKGLRGLAPTPYHAVCMRTLRSCWLPGAQPP